MSTECTIDWMTCPCDRCVTDRRGMDEAYRDRDDEDLDDADEVHDWMTCSCERCADERLEMDEALRRRAEAIKAYTFAATIQTTASGHSAVYIRREGTGHVAVFLGREERFASFSDAEAAIERATVRTSGWSRLSDPADVLVRDEQTRQKGIATEAIDRSRALMRDAMPRR